MNAYVCPTGDPDHKPASDGLGCAWRKRAYSIVVEARDAEGNLIPGKKIRIPQPMRIVTHSRFDPTGLVYALCQHGLAEHPDPEIQRTTRQLGWSWIRSKYLDQNGKCPTCHDEAAPADLTTARA